MWITRHEWQQLQQQLAAHQQQQQTWRETLAALGWVPRFDCPPFGVCADIGPDVDALRAALARWTAAPDWTAPPERAKVG